MCSKSLKCVTFLVCCVQNTQNLQCSPGGGANGQMVQNFDDLLYFPGVHWVHLCSLAMSADSVNFA